MPAGEQGAILQRLDGLGEQVQGVQQQLQGVQQQQAVLGQGLGLVLEVSVSAFNTAARVHNARTSEPDHRLKPLRKEQPPQAQGAATLGVLPPAGTFPATIGHIGRVSEAGAGLLHRLALCLTIPPADACQGSCQHPLVVELPDLCLRLPTQLTGDELNELEAFYEADFGHGQTGRPMQPARRGQLGMLLGWWLAPWRLLPAQQASMFWPPAVVNHHALAWPRSTSKRAHAAMYNCCS